MNAPNGPVVAGNRALLRATFTDLDGEPAEPDERPTLRVYTQHTKLLATIALEAQHQVSAGVYEIWYQTQWAQKPAIFYEFSAPVNGGTIKLGRRVLPLTDTG